MTRQTKLALIGAGRWGQRILRAVRHLDGAHLEFVCDTDPAVVNELRRAGVPVTSNVADVLGGSAVEGVLIATPSASHVELARAALDHFKHVLVEKPLAFRSCDAEGLCALARRNDRALMVGHIVQYQPTLRALLQTIRRGELGAIRQSVSIRRSIPGGPDPAWWALGPHDVSIACSVHGAEPIAASALETKERRLFATRLDFADRSRAFILSQIEAHSKSRRLAVEGTFALAASDELRSADRLEIYAPRRDALHAVVAPELEAESTALLARIGFPALRTAETSKTEHCRLVASDEEPLLLELRTFLGAMRGAADVPSDGREAVRVTRVLEAAQCSADRGGALVKLASPAVEALANWA